MKLATMLEDAGIEFILPVARWIGHGGPTNFEGDSLETFTWAAGLVALTKKITLVVTSHTTVIHPVAAAKSIATIDQISPSRVALNIVAGWNKPGKSTPQSWDTTSYYEFGDFRISQWSADVRKRV